jgi:hypothetical protein
MLRAVLGGLGGVAGAFAGYTYRYRLSSMVPDMLLALIEDLVAVGGGFLLSPLVKTWSTPSGAGIIVFYRLEVVAHECGCEYDGKL